MAEPDGPSDAECSLVIGGFAGVALALLLEGQGTAVGSERTLGLIAALVAALALWWRWHPR